MSSNSNSDHGSELQGSNSDVFKDRLLIAMQGASTNSFAKKCGIGESTFRKYLAGSIPSLDKASIIADEAGVQLQWLATGKGEQWITHATGSGKTKTSNEVISRIFENTPKNEISTDAEQVRAAFQSFGVELSDTWAERFVDILVGDFQTIQNAAYLATFVKGKLDEQSGDTSEFAMVPGYNVEVAAGAGAFPDQEEPSRKLAFRHKWLKYRGLKADDLALVFAKGDSMEPTISDNNTLMIDTSQKELNDGQIYVIRTDGHLIVKRIQKLWKKGILLISDNKEYKEQQVEPNEADDLEVIGRVVWIGKDV